MSAERDVLNISKKLGLLKSGLVSRENIEALTLIAKDKILVRTVRQSVDIENNDFEGYSPRYAQKEGKTRVNLVKTNVMMGSMTQKAMSNREGRVFFNNKEARDRALIHNVRGSGKSRVIRRFFGLTKSDKDEIIRKTGFQVSENIGKAGLA